MVNAVSPISHLCYAFHDMLLICYKSPAKRESAAHATLSFLRGVMSPSQERDEGQKPA